MEKRLTLNAEKRKTIADVFQNFWEKEDSPIIKKYSQAKENYDILRQATKTVVERLVRKYQPQEDIDTVREMSNKYGRSGGEIFEDNCFYFTLPSTKVNSDGEEYETNDELHIDFTLRPNRTNNFGIAYYRDLLKSKGFDADYDYRWSGDRRNPRYYDIESSISKFLGFSSNNDVSGNDKTNYCSQWENDFKLSVIGSSYCHSRQFKVNQEEYETLKMFIVAQENLVNAHEQIFSYVEEKMKKLRLGLKSYKYFDQAKTLADKLGIPLNESILNESSSMALSIYSPENLASLLEDKVEMTREEKIALFRKEQAQSIN